MTNDNNKTVTAENEDERFAIRISHDSYKFNNTGDVIEIEATKFLQKGGFGITYLGKYRQYLGKLDRTVVAERKVTIKEFFMSNNVCRRNESDNSVVVQDSERFNYFRSKFDKEASALSEINRLPNIAHVIHIFEENNTSYYVMDYIEGCDLYTYIENHGPFKSLKDAWSYLRPICECLQKVHEKGIIHCDIAPNNIIVEPTKDAGGINKFVLIDFGSCRSWDVQTDEGANFTVASHTPYNPYFSPLELVNRGEYSARYPESSLEKIKVSADVYSLGAVLYYMLVGNKYLRKSEKENLRCSKSGTPYAKCRDIILNDFDFQSTMEKEAVDLIKKIMQPAAEDRIQSVGELIRTCDKMSENLSIPMQKEKIYAEKHPESLDRKINNDNEKAPHKPNETIKVNSNSQIKDEEFDIRERLKTKLNVSEKPSIVGKKEKEDKVELFIRYAENKTNNKLNSSSKAIKNSAKENGNVKSYLWSLIKVILVVAVIYLSLSTSITYLPDSIIFKDFASSTLVGKIAGLFLFILTLSMTYFCAAIFLSEKLFEDWDINLLFLNKLLSNDVWNKIVLYANKLFVFLVLLWLSILIYMIFMGIIFGEVFVFNAIGSLF